MNRRERPRVVIVGGGFGGLAAARALRREAVAVTLIDRQNHHLFQPLLYQVATAGLSSTEISYPIRSILHRQKNTEVMMGEVLAVDAERKNVVLADRAVPYDHLILAAGVRHSYFGHSGWESRAPGLKDLVDAQEIRRRILTAFEQAEFESDPHRRRSLLTFVIVGAGPTGVELAGAIGEMACHALSGDFRHIDPREARIVLLEAGNRVLPGFPFDLSAKAETALRRMCVDVRLDSPVKSIDRDNVVIDSGPIPAATVIWAAGVQASRLGGSLGTRIDPKGRVMVEPDLSVPGHPEISVVGDLAAFLHQTGEPLPGTAPVAIQQGQHAARNVIRRLGGARPRSFRYRDKGILATIGRGAAVARIGKLKLWGLPAWIAWALVHVFALIGFRNRLIIMIEWAWSYVTYKRSARLVVDMHPDRRPDASDPAPPDQAADESRSPEEDP